MSEYEYINREDLLNIVANRIKDYGRDSNSRAQIIAGIYCEVKTMIERIPSEDVKPVVCAEVVTTVDEWHVIHQNCSICNEELEYKAYPNFCPNCGADMRGSKNA